MINENWSRWITASIAKHFDVRKSGVHLYIEGQTLDTQGKTRWAELRTEGPRFSEKTKNSWEIDIDLNVLCSAVFSNQIYDIDAVVGIFHKAMSTTIKVYKFGTGPSDNPTFLLGCLERVTDVDTFKLGIIQTDTKISQHAVECSFRMSL